jgi:WD40 repeat protein
VKAVGISGDARHLVSADEDGEQTVWDVYTGTPLRRTPASHGTVPEIAGGADGSVTSKCVQHIMRWSITADVEPDVTSRTDDRPEQLRGLPLAKSEYVHWWSRVGAGHEWMAVTERMRNPNWSGDQHDYCVYVGDDEGPVRTTVRFEDHSLGAATATPDGRRLITCSWPSRTRVWDVETGALLGTIPGDQAAAVACSSDGRIVVMAAYSGVLSIWDLDAALDVQRRTASHSRPVADAKISADETLGYTVSVDGTAITWDLRKGTALCVIAPEASSARDADWSVMTAMIDAEKGLVRFLVRDADFRWALGELNSYDLKTGASRSNDGLPMTQFGGFETEDREAIFARGEPFALPHGGESETALAVSPDGVIGATSGRGQTVWLWDLVRQARIASIGLDSTPSSCALTTGGRTLLVGEESGRVHILRLLGIGGE